MEKTDSHIILDKIDKLKMDEEELEMNGYGVEYNYGLELLRQFIINMDDVIKKKNVK